MDGFWVSGIERGKGELGSFLRFAGAAFRGNSVRSFVFHVVKAAIKRVRSFIFAILGNSGTAAPVVESGSFKFVEWCGMLGVDLD